MSMKTARVLVGMQVVEAQLIEERLLDDLMHEEKGRHPYCLGPGTKCAREMAVDEHRAAVRAVTGDIGNVIVVTDTRPPAEHLHVISSDVLRFVPDLAFKLHADALCMRKGPPRYCGGPSRLRN
jgi:hypothetical protein